MAETVAGRAYARVNTVRCARLLNHDTKRMARFVQQRRAKSRFGPVGDRQRYLLARQNSWQGCSAYAPSTLSQVGADLWRGHGS
jgi:lysylphosphatidylglycerol synthetase-like protein (DUF2156 family)